MPLKVVISLSIITILINILLIGKTIWHWNKGSSSPFNVAYTYMGHDFPETLPLPDLPRVSLQVEESDRYPLLGLESDPQWFSLTSSSAGYVRLGNSSRLFMVTMFHELHCLRLLNLAFEPTGFPGSHAYIQPGHLKHCLDYLRQMALCSADLTLERGDFALRDFENDRVGATHICYDWSVVYDFMENNWDKWVNHTN